jgi:membrane peptidoglycan carboxypeptidase
MQIGKRLYSLLLFLLVSGIGGLLVAGLTVPAAAMVSAAGGAVAEGLNSLPEELETPRPAERSVMLMANGKQLASFYQENRTYVELDKVSQVMQDAQIAIEDNRFYEHGAIDLRGTLRALVSTSQGVTQGGSSITQQYVRLVLVEEAERVGGEEGKRLKILAQENTLARKVRELRYAIAIEKRMEKSEILERYLNIAYYGDGAYGVEAAAQHYFGVSAAKLDLAQAAMLAGLVRNPIQTNPVKFPELAIERRNNVLDRMEELKLITAAEATAAKAVPWDKGKVKSFPNGCVNSAYPFVCDYARLTIENAKELGDTKAERQAYLMRGGLTIQTEFDVDLQKEAQQVLSKVFDPTDPVISVIVAVDPQTGYIQAMAQSRPNIGDNKTADGKDDWRGETYYNYAADKAMGGAEGFQAGSTFKLFVATAALNQGMGVNTTYMVKSPMDFKDHVFRTCDGMMTQNKSWVVRGSVGKMNMYEGVRRSVNGYFIQLEQGAGICESVKMAQTLGLASGLGESLMDLTYNGALPSFTLGTVDITPLSMVRAYGTIANKGKRCDPILISSIKNMYGQEQPIPSANCKQVISEELANSVAHVFKQSMYGTSSAVNLRYGDMDMAGKTGTVDSNKAIWQVSITPNLAVAAVISYDSNKRFKDFYKTRTNRYIKGVKVKGKWLQAASGSEAGGLLVRPVFKKAMETREHMKFPAADQKILRGEYASVPSCSGRSLKSCQSVLESAGFVWYTIKDWSDAPEGAFTGQLRPSGKAPKNSAIGLVISKGKKPEPKPDPTPTPTPTAPLPGPTKSP